MVMFLKPIIPSTIHSAWTIFLLWTELHTECQNNIVIEELTNAISLSHKC